MPSIKTLFFCRWSWWAPVVTWSWQKQRERWPRAAQAKTEQEFDANSGQSNTSSLATVDRMKFSLHTWFPSGNKQETLSAHHWQTNKEQCMWGACPRARKYFGSLPVLTILTPQQAAAEGLLGLAYGGAFLSGHWGRSHDFRWCQHPFRA